MGKKFLIGDDIFGGNILIKLGLHRRGAIKIILFTFCLILVYMSLRFAITNTQVQIVKNEKIIQDLRSEYNNKQAMLLKISQKNEVGKRLKELGSELIEPTAPPMVVVQENKNGKK